MAQALASIPQANHPDLLVGFNKADDAGVFRINDEIALVQTVDFFPPIVDDPFYFGQIAAANALSDVYAMGGKPLTALSIVGFPSNLPPYVLTDILKGGSSKVEEAGAVIVGGHSIKDKELKYGLAISGIIHPQKIVSNSGARVGDCLYLTKKLGTGLITTAIKQDAVPTDIIDLCIKQMAELNKPPAEVMVKHNVTSATDITGFGLLGHTLEMAEGSGVTIKLKANQLPLLPLALEMAEAKMIPGGANANRDYLNGKVQFADGLDTNLVHVMFDPQTSGGLLMAIPQDSCQAFEKEMTDNLIEFARIGSVVEKTAFPLIVE